MTNKDWALRAVGLGKCYQLYAQPYQRLLQMLLRGRRQFYREFWALRNVTLECARGETLGIIGRNGSGKSTLLQLLAGTSFATEGRVETRGRVAALLELGSGFNPEFTGRENVYLNSAVLGRSRRETEAMFDAIEDFADIGAFIDQPISTYSSGMTMRLAFAVAIHSLPDILIIDEALAVGDTAFQSKCLARIRRMQGAGVAILFVSHSANAVLEFCDRAAYLVAGELRMLGACRDVLEAYADDQVQIEGGVVNRARGASVTVDPALAGGTRASLPADPPERAAASEIVAVALTDEHGRPRETFAHGDLVCVNVDVAFHNANPAPCLGIQVRTTDDIVLWATTTLYMGTELPATAAGDRRQYKWRLRASLGGNRFVFGLGIGTVEDGEYRRQNRRHFAGYFDVLPQPRHGTGWLELDAEFVGEQARGAFASADRDRNR